MTEPTERPRAQTLDDIALAPVAVAVTRPDGRQLEIVLQPLSSEALWQLRRRVTWPKPPVKDMTKAGPVYDYGDEGYQRAVEDANREFSLRVLLAMLQLEIPGETEDERLEQLRRKLGGTVLAQLTEAAQRLNIVSPEELAAVAHSFRAA